MSRLHRARALALAALAVVLSIIAVSPAELLAILGAGALAGVPALIYLAASPSGPRPLLLEHRLHRLERIAHAPQPIVTPLELALVTRRLERLERLLGLPVVTTGELQGRTR